MLALPTMMPRRLQLLLHEVIEVLFQGCDKSLDQHIIDGFSPIIA